MENKKTKTKSFYKKIGIVIFICFLIYGICAFCAVQRAKRIFPTAIRAVIKIGGIDIDADKDVINKQVFNLMVNDPGNIVTDNIEDTEKVRNFFNKIKQQRQETPQQSNNGG